MAILRNQRTYPLSLKSTTAYSLNQGIVSAYDYAGNPANAYAGGDGAPHIGNLTLGHAGLPSIVSLNGGQILARDTSQGKTVITPYTGLSVGAMGFGSSDGKGSWTIHRRYRTPTSYSGTSANRDIATYRDAAATGGRLSILMTESISNPWCYFFVEAGSTSNSLPPTSTRNSAAAFQVPSGSIVDLYITRSGDVVKFYLARQADPQPTLAHTLTVPTFLLYNTNWAGIPTGDGAGSGNPTDLLLIDHTIWNRTLSDAEVAQHRADPYAGYVNNAVVADGITIISPAPNAIVSNEGFTISGAYQGGSPTSIQARFNGGTWTTIVTNPSGGSYTGTFPTVAKATGLLEVRYGNNTAVTASVANITANPPAPTLSITNQPSPDGQSVSITVSYQRTDSITFSLNANGNGAASLTDVVATTYSTTSASTTKTFAVVAPGDYTVGVVATGPSATTSVVGAPFTILGVAGGGSLDAPAGTAVVPGTPTNVTATATPTGATVLFNPPASDGGSTITNFTVTASTGQVVNVQTSPAIFVLPKGTPVSFTVKAVNDIGPSPASDPSNIVIPASVPGAATNVVASVVQGSVSVSFTMPTDTGGYPVTNCLVEASTGEIAEGTQSPIVINVPIASAATFTVRIENVLGYGPPSLPSNSVLPKASTATVTLVNLAGVPIVGLSGLKWAWFDQSLPSEFAAPTDKGSVETTAGDGKLVVDIPNSALRAGQTGWLTVTNSDGTVGTIHQVFSGPVEAT